MTISVNVNGEIKKVRAIYTNVNGTWHRGTGLYTRVGGIWRCVLDNKVAIMPLRRQYAEVQDVRISAA